MQVKFEADTQADPRTVARRDGFEAVFSTPNQATAWRVETLFTKEPDTMEWIASFAPGEILYDVGANVGMYSVWAAITRKACVYAFEPESQNFALLNRNIWINGLGDRVTAMPLAISDVFGMDKLYLSGFFAGGSYHNYGKQSGDEQPAVPVCFAQGCIAANLDHLVDQGWLPVPHHIKIDVDGIEPKVVAGARKTLADQMVKSVLIEIDSRVESHWNTVDALLDLGFDYSREQVDKSMAKNGAFNGLSNYVFRR